MKICPKCSIEHDKAGMFCSRSCANSRSWNDSDKLKKSKSAKGKYFGNFKGVNRPLDENTKAKIAEKSRERGKDRFLAGVMTERNSLRKHLAILFGYKCSVCYIEEWGGKPITLQVDHKDGNAGNNAPENLRLICPNCHSQSETFSGRNKGNGRKARGLPLK